VRTIPFDRTASIVEPLRCERSTGAIKRITTAAGSAFNHGGTVLDPTRVQAGPRATSGGNIVESSSLFVAAFSRHECSGCQMPQVTKTVDVKCHRVWCEQWMLNAYRLKQWMLNVNKNFRTRRCMYEPPGFLIRVLGAHPRRCRRAAVWFRQSLCPSRAQCEFWCARLELAAAPVIVSFIVHRWFRSSSTSHALTLG